MRWLKERVKKIVAKLKKLNFVKLSKGWVYPPLCLSCKSFLEEGPGLFCSTCLDHITLIEPAGRCPRCFHLFSNKTFHCSFCASSPLALRKHAAVCERLGPIQGLVSSFERGYIGFAKTIASLIVLQHHRLDYTTPDLIIPLPTHFFSKGGIRSSLPLLIAKEVGKFFEKPVFPFLKKTIDFTFFKEGGVSLTKLKASFKKEEITDKRVLLISLSTDRESLLQASELLLEGFPRSIESLSFF